jgi:hypothetical protein
MNNDRSVATIVPTKGGVFICPSCQNRIQSAPDDSTANITCPCGQVLELAEHCYYVAGDPA